MAKKTHILTVLDFERAEVNFYGITKKQSENIEDYLFEDIEKGGLGYNESNIQYMTAEYNLIDSNITDVQDAFDYLINNEDEN